MSKVEVPKGWYDMHVYALLAKGWVLRCGHCRRRLNTDYAKETHTVFADLSGRCLCELPAETVTDYVSTSFFADPHESDAVKASVWDEAYGNGVADAWQSFDYDGGQTPAARVNPYKPSELLDGARA